MTPKIDKFYFILPDKTHQQALLLPTDGGWTLPCCEVAAPDVIDLMDTECFNRVVKKQFGIDVTTLYALDTPNTENVIKIAAFENHTHEWEPPERARWIGREALDNLPLVEPLIRSVLETWFAEFTESNTVEPLMPWSKIGWFDEAAIWITEQLHCLGITAHSSVEQVKSFYTGGTLRVNTDVGYIYFKAVSRAFIREMEITQMLAEWFPARIPVMLAADSERRWMLLRDIGGIDLNKISEIEVWEDVLRVYAQIQIDSLTFVDKLLNGPFYDYRIQTMVSEIDSVIIDTPSLLQGYHECLNETELENLRSLSPQLKALCAEVESYSVPCTLEHGDFHDGNIRITKDGPVFYDWAWSCVTHPFLGPSGLLYKAANPPHPPLEKGGKGGFTNARARLRDAYLEVWTVYEPLNRLRELFNLIEQWNVLHAVLIDAEWVAAIQKELSHRVPLRYSFTEWALQRRQYYLARVIRRLFNLKL